VDIGKRAEEWKVYAGTYRYGFNGKEKDVDGEWGSNTHYDYGFRIYNPAIAKFLSVDPLRKEYPWYTPYQFAGNTPIQAIDLDGLEPTSPIEDWAIGSEYVHGQMFKADNYWVFASTSSTADDIHQYYDPDDELEPWKQFEPLVAKPIAQDVSQGSAIILGGVVVAVVAAPIVIENAGAFIIKEAAEFAVEELTGIPILNGPEDVAEFITKKIAKKKAVGALGDRFEQQIKDKFSKKLIKQNEILKENGKVVGEIDFETADSLFEVGLSLSGKSKQLHRLAKEAKKRKKKLTVVYDYEKTSKGTLKSLQESLKKKHGSRVRFVPDKVVENP